MNKEEYLAAQNQLLKAGNILSRIDLEGFLKQISKTETLAPLIDPTLYRKAMSNLEAIKRLAMAGVSMQKAWQDTFAAVVETFGRGDMELPES